MTLRIKDLGILVFVVAVAFTAAFFVAAAFMGGKASPPDTMFLCYGQNERCTHDACSPDTVGKRDREFYSQEAYCFPTENGQECYHSHGACADVAPDGRCKLVETGRAEPDKSCRPDCAKVAKKIVETVMGSDMFRDAGADLQDMAHAMKEDHIDTMHEECERQNITKEQETCIMESNSLEEMQQCP